MNILHADVNLYHFLSLIKAADCGGSPTTPARFHALPPPRTSSPRASARRACLPVTTMSAASCVRDFCWKPAANAAGRLDAAGLRRVEDRAIREIVRFQQDIGLKAITDGEYRRSCFHIDFLDQLDGVKTTQPKTVVGRRWQRVAGAARHARDSARCAMRATSRSTISNSCRPACAQAAAAKVAIPSPTMLHFRGGRDGISREAYPELEPTFYDDVARAYGDELRALACRGLPLRAAGRHQPRLSLRSEDARSRARARR